MASDHRGRELHAGKRTAQEMGWSESGKVNDGIINDEDTFSAYKDTSLDKMSVRRSSREDARTNWSVTKYGKGVTEQETNLGSAKGIAPGTDLVVFGSTRTPARALIAAEAMNKRIEEGRDLKTGRPKK